MHIQSPLPRFAAGDFVYPYSRNFKRRKRNEDIPIKQRTATTNVSNPPQPFHHLIDALFLLFQIGMNIEIERGGDVGMPKNGADSLVVASALHTPCSKSVAKAMEFLMGNTQLLQETAVIVTVNSRFSGFGFIRKHEKIIGHLRAPRTNHLHHILADGNLTD